MNEVIFLFVLAIIWISFAVVQDLRKREVANWLNFSLIIFALGFRFFYSLFSSGTDFAFFYQGLMGLGIFFIIGNLLYSGKMFAGGDAKLMIALGTILPLSNDFFTNVKFFVLFFFLFLLTGAIYSLTISIVLTIKNFKIFKKEFFRQLRKNKKLIYPVSILGLILMILGFVNILFFGFGVLLFIMPYFYVYAKAVDESCMVKKIRATKLSEGDWIYEDIKLGKRKIIANWDGLSKEDIKKIKKKYRLVKIRQGIPFTPAFLFGFLIFILFYFWPNLWNSFW